MTFVTWKPVIATASKQIGSTTKKIAVRGVIVNSHTSGTWRFVNGTAGQYATATSVGGTYTPAAGSSDHIWEPIEFDSGCYMAVAGTLDATVLYRELSDI